MIKGYNGFTNSCRTLSNLTRLILRQHFPSYTQTDTRPRHRKYIMEQKFVFSFTFYIVQLQVHGDDITHAFSFYIFRCQFHEKPTKGCFIWMAYKLLFLYIRICMIFLQKGIYLISNCYFYTCLRKNFGLFRLNSTY